MPLFYIRQGEVEVLSKKTGVASYRLSEQRRILYGGRGGKYDELQYLRNRNSSAVGVDTRGSDAWTKFGTANGAAGTRADQIVHDFTKNGTFP